MRQKLIIVILMAFILCGCSIAQAEINPKIEVSSYSEQIIELKQTYNLDINCDSSDIELYTWNNSDIKFEITKRVRGAYKKEVLSKRLEDFEVEIKNENNSVFLKSRCNGGNKNALDRSVDLKIYVPKVIETMNYKVDAGNIKFFDDIQGVLKAELNNTNLEINRFDGVLNVTGNMGNVKVLSGKISGCSKIEKYNGNISIKSEFDENGEYIFNTSKGHIDIYAPSNTKLGFETVGELEINEFDDAENFGRTRSSEVKLNDKPVKVRVNSEMGRIAIRKY
ncbi:DUF4097 family beta strand repeat-containing protein [Acetivibrio cellulolyticus]|uniref:hypothetical protein n=1 Tax=Acetivibrio cellulolyticus TaxID=35830 RepID=UPI0001E2BDDC|nr:hypothetical protein [Acetivibrio cellulolyticus]